ncbi:hypothetical protein Tco_0940583 [Tanacetum coccineum]|uniref:Uncharacterized protein n=1 Tax=Tanacetum coccineum TaxID=301880 RepID=A0ABQ5DPB1_9ASTR
MPGWPASGSGNYRSLTKNWLDGVDYSTRTCCPALGVSGTRLHLIRISSSKVPYPYHELLNKPSYYQDEGVN